MASPGSHSREVRDGRIPLSWYPHPGPVGPHHSLPARDKHLGAPCPPPTEAEGEPLPWGPLGLVGTWLSWGAEAGCSTAVDPCRDEEPCLTFSGLITPGGLKHPLRVIPGGQLHLPMSSRPVLSSPPGRLPVGTGYHPGGLVLWGLCENNLTHL